MNKFLTNYLDLMADLNKQQDGLLWWATDIASKNRFQSPLPGLLQQSSSAPKLTGIWQARAVYILRCLWHALRTLGRVIWIKAMLGPTIQSRLKKAGQYCVVKSFLYLRSFTSDHVYRDTFMGDLVDYLNMTESLLVLVDMPSDFFKCVQQLRRSARPPLVVPWEYFLTIPDVLQSTIKGLLYKPKPLSRLLFGQTDVTALVGPLLKYGRAKIQPYQLFHYPAVVNLCHSVKVQRFILTHESNPWEKMCILGLRRFAPEARIIGYQHNVIPQASANMFISVRERGFTPLPDKIITTGEEPKRVMEENQGYKPGMIEAGCALRTEPLQENSAPRQKIKNILVALEGVDGAHALASYVIDQMKEQSKYRVVFRTHPVLPWSYFQRKYGCNLMPYKHFILSKGQTLKNDILACDVVIYWGSTVGMEALGLGCPVIHFDNGSVLSFDPLFRCPYLKWVVKPAQPLSNIIQTIDKVSDADFLKARSSAMDYLKSYFAPVSKECLAKFRR